MIENLKIIKMEKESNIRQEDLLNTTKNNKELVILFDKKIKPYIHYFQKNFVDFCKDKTGIQNEENFFKLSISDQMKFNECIDDTSNKVKKDFTDLEKFYFNCKNVCYKNYDKITLDKQIEEYVNSSFRIYSTIHPCINDCMDLYAEFTHRYFTYMIEGINNCYKNLP